MRWDWQIGRTFPLKRTGRRSVDIYDIDGFLTTKARFTGSAPPGLPRRSPTRGPSATSTWPGRTIARTAAPSRRAPSQPRRIGKVYFGFPEERWVDFRQLDALRPMLTEQDCHVRAQGL